MSKIRSLSLFFVFAMLVGILAACGKEDPYYMFSKDLEPLTDEQIEQYNSVYRESILGPFDEYVNSKSEDMRERAENAYLGLKWIKNDIYSPYLGTFGDVIVCGTSINSEEDEYILGGERFDMGSLRKITAYRDGKFVTLSQAYNSGWLTDADIAVIAERIEQYEAKRAK